MLLPAIVGRVARLDGDEGPATCRGDGPGRRNLDVDGGTIIAGFGDSCAEGDRSIRRRRPPEADRELEGDGRRRLVEAPNAHQVPGRGPVRVTVEECPEDAAVDDALEGLVVSV